MQFVWGKGKWLWMLLIPLAVCSVPFLLIAMLIGSRLLSIIAGPVNIWNTTWHAPLVDDFVGSYEFSEIRWGGQPPVEDAVARRSGFRLNADHSAEIIDVPAFDGFGQAMNCTYNGTGHWR